MASAPEDVFARRLRQRRREISMTQTQVAESLAEKLGAKVFTTTINKIETGRRAVKLNEAVCIAEVLDVSLTWLLDDDRDVERRLRELDNELSHHRSQIVLSQEAVQEAKAAARGTQDAIDELRAEIQE